MTAQRGCGDGEKLKAKPGKMKAKPGKMKADEQVFCAPEV